MTILDEGSVNIQIPLSTLEFNGSNQYVALPDLNIGGSMTVAAWINMTSQDLTDSSYPNIIFKKNSNDGNQGICWALGVYHNVNKVTFLRMGADRPTGAGAGAGGRAFVGTHIFSLNDWHHLAATYTYGSVSTGTIKLYLDGILESTYTDTEDCSGLTYTCAEGTFIGGNIGEHFSGQIRDVRLYSGVALTDNQITQLSNGIDITDNLYAHWEFRDRDGIELSDRLDSFSGGIHNSAKWSPGNIDCWCTSWDEGNWDLTTTFIMNAKDRNYLFHNVIPGAVGELYNILGSPYNIDNTYSSSNTIILEPRGGYGVSGIRERRVIGVKNITDDFVNKDTYTVKIEGFRLGVV